MPNTFAYLILFSWPLVVFFLLRNYQTKFAVFYAIVLSTLLLPVLTIDPPLLPPLNKSSITSLALLLGLLLLGRRTQFFEPGLVTKVIFATFLTVFITTGLNSDSFVSGAVVLRGLSFYDGFTAAIKQLLFLVPFLLGRYYFKDILDNNRLFKFLVVSALVYSMPILFEIRMSPQLHTWIYGFSPTVFAQQMRDGGFRPIVFMGHGLPLAFWFSTCLIAAGVLHKNKIRYCPFKPFFVVIYMLIVLVLCKTLSALLYASIGLVFIYRLSPIKQIKWSFLLSIMVFIYPLAQLLGVFPSEDIIQFINEFNPARAQSLQFRFANEEVLLNHAMERPFFGWGGWGRNRLFDDNGKDLVVTDGKWILELGMNGFLGFMFYYAILLIPIYLAAKALTFIKDSKQQYYFSSLTIILAISIVDSIPNTNMGPIQFLLAGALLGQSEFLIKLGKKTGVLKR